MGGRRGLVARTGGAAARAIDASPCSTAAVFPASAAAHVQYAVTNGQIVPLWYSGSFGVYGQKVGVPNATTGARRIRAARCSGAAAP